MRDASGIPRAAITSWLVRLPEAGKAAEVEIGQSMISSVRGALLPTALILKQDVAAKGKVLGIGANIHIPAGTLRPGGQRGGGAYYYSTDGWLKYATESKPRKNFKVGIFVSTSPGVPPKAFFDSPAFTREYDVTPFEYDFERCLMFEETSFRRELVYSGVSQGTVSISYREFSNDMARPAFTQELKYDLKEGTEVGYRGARFEIVRATNTSIAYKVVRPLE